MNHKKKNWKNKIQKGFVIGKLTDLLIANGIERLYPLSLSDLEIVKLANLMIDKDRQKKPY